MKTLPYFVIAIAVGLLGAEFVEASQVVVPGLKPEDPLEISDIVVRGIVESVKSGQFDISDGSPGTTPSFLPSWTVHLRLSEVLRGTWTGPDIAFVALHDRDALVKGQEYIVCGVWNKTRRVFVTAPHIGIYAKNGGDRWIKQLRHPGSVFEAEPDTLTNAEVRARLENGSLNSVTRRSDVIVAGSIVSTKDSVYAVSDGRHGKMRRYRVHVSEVLKGQVKSGHVEFVIPLGLHLPAWTRFTPRIDVGQDWLLFLQAGEEGLYPFAGRNSLLLIRENRLIYNSIVDYPQTRSETIRRIRSEVRLGEK